ncbi:hypothetical protein QYM36_007518, partial [Artemia franciscana]
MLKVSNEIPATFPKDSLLPFGMPNSSERDILLGIRKKLDQLQKENKYEYKGKSKIKSKKKKKKAKDSDAEDENDDTVLGEEDKNVKESKQNAGIKESVEDIKE